MDTIVTTPTPNINILFLSLEEVACATGSYWAHHLGEHLPLVVVARDTTGETWAVQIDGDTIADGFATTTQAAIAAAGLVLTHMANVAFGDADTPERTAARAWLSRLTCMPDQAHQAFRDIVHRMDAQVGMLSFLAWRFRDDVERQLKDAREACERQYARARQLLQPPSMPWSEDKEKP